MKNSMQLKAIIKNISKEKGIVPQALMQNYMLERLLERISVSNYKDKFILKGGMLIAAMIGLDSRTTMDMDATLRGMQLTEETIRNALSHILSLDLGDNITFILKSIAPIREDDIYGGYRASISAIFDTIKTALKIDLTAGDKITPKEISYRFALMFEDRSIDVLAYNLETVLAEKYETILRRSTMNTRMRDFYDIYILMNFQLQNINGSLLKKAVHATAASRESTAVLSDVDTILNLLSDDEAMKSAWALYQRDFSYAKSIIWSDIIKSLRLMSDLIS
ncbi:MAG: nucleotidyl transferase AbiEii/AbiGii toxin family protein [Oscillospiraceae bacterium]|nr:nucleotidyl transferase AbiEii/AbiGii toxin family protein [Oscillospiraceae bacterium]